MDVPVTGSSVGAALVLVRVSVFDGSTVTVSVTVAVSVGGFIAVHGVPVVVHDGVVTVVHGGAVVAANGAVMVAPPTAQSS